MIEEMNKVKALFPDNVEKLIITKNDYDRLTGELTLENIELKQEIERLNNIINEAREFIKEHKQKGYRTPMTDDYEFWDELDGDEIKELLEILDKVKELKENTNESKENDDIR